MISIIIVNYNTKNATAECLDSLFAFSDFWGEIIVVDNNSQDGSVDLLRGRFPSIKILENQENLGFAQANNQAATQATGKILFFLNSDTLIQEDIFSAIKEDFFQKKDLGGLAPTLLTEQGELQEHACGDFPGVLSLLTNKIRPYQKKETSSDLSEVDWVSGAALAVRKDVFEQVGGFDHNFFMYFEDIDLCYRIKKEGYKIVRDNRMFVLHRGGVSFGSNNKQKKQYYYNSQDHYFRKQHGRAVMWGIKMLRFPYKFFKER